MYKITIIVPIYNAEQYLRDTLESIVNQTMNLEDIQVIMIDDVSTDSSTQIMDEYSEKYSNFMSIKLKENHKVAGAARNIGLEKAEGKYIMFADADDFYMNNACEVLYNEIEGKNADFITSNYINADFDGKVWDKPIFAKEKYKDFKMSIYDYDKSFYVLNSAVWNKIFRKSFIDENNIKFLEGVVAEDAYFTMSSFMKSENVWYCSKVIYGYRQRNKGNTGKKSVSFNCSVEYFDQINRAYKEIYENFKKNDHIAFYRFVYAKNMSYMLYKFVDSDICDRSKINIMKEMQWFYKLSEELKVPGIQKSQKMVIEKICKGEYTDALNYCKIMQEMRSYMIKETRENMVKPDAKVYKEINKYSEEFERKKECLN